MSGGDRAVDVEQPHPRAAVMAAEQARYHHERFGRLAEPAVMADVIQDLSGSLDPQGWLGLDQMGHFGPQGCERAANRIARECSTVGTLVELGSGYGGALRDVVDRLGRQGRPVARAVGIDLVVAHCVAARTISTEITRSRTSFAVGDAAATPLRGGAADVVVAIGSMPHFAQPSLVVREAARLLRPGGLLVLFEEVSLVPRHAPAASTAFTVTHPSGVFYRSTVPDRMAALGGAGFEVDVEDLSSWAHELLTARLKALRLLRGTAERVYGAHEVEVIERTLQSAIDEYASGRLLPRFIIGRLRADR
jgi:SAM-dependent methyltransferase